MPTLLEKEIARAVDGKLTPPPPPPPSPSPSPSPSRRAPVVRFSPMFAEPPLGAQKRRRSLIALSVATHVVLFVVVLLMPRRAQTVDDPALPIEITFAAPVPEISAPVSRPAPPKAPPKSKPLARREEAPQVAETLPTPPKPVIPEVVVPAVAKVEPPRPRAEVKTGLLDESPSGPAIVASKTSRSIVTASGFDGAAGSASSRARPGRVMEAAFDAPAAGRSKTEVAGAVKSSGFSEEIAPAAKRREREPVASASDTDVEILSKPKPIYTDEARDLRIEGDVVLDVTFSSGGVLRVLGVAAGLGHGLDEAAIAAARMIRFNPAKRGGIAVDHTAKLRVVFRLA